MRFLRFRQWLDRLPFAPTAVYYEEVRRHRGTDAAHIYGGLQGQLTSWCEERGIPYQGIPVGSIKKHATGKGNVGKDEMIIAAQQAGLMSTDDNEVDAWWLLDLVLKEEEEMFR